MKKYIKCCEIYDFGGMTICLIPIKIEGRMLDATPR